MKIKQFTVLVVLSGMSLSVFAQAESVNLIDIKIIDNNKYVANKENPSDYASVVVSVHNSMGFDSKTASQVVVLENSYDKELMAGKVNSSLVGQYPASIGASTIAAISFSAPPLDGKYTLPPKVTCSIKPKNTAPTVGKQLNLIITVSKNNCSIVEPTY